MTIGKLKGTAHPVNSNIKSTKVIKKGEPREWYEITCPFCKTHFVNIGFVDTSVLMIRCSHCGNKVRLIW